jgi:hypothetical protein
MQGRAFLRHANFGRSDMGRHARIGLLLAGTCCLLAVMADWIVEELNKLSRQDTESSGLPAPGKRSRRAVIMA